MANALDEFKKKYKQYQTDPTSTDSLASNLDDFRAKYAEYAPSAGTSANERRLDVQDRLNTINKINSDATQFAINNYNNKVNNMLDARQNLYDSRLGANNYNILQDAIDWKNNVMSFANQQNGIAQKGLNNLLQTARDTNSNRIGNISQQDAMRLQDIDKAIDFLKGRNQTNPGYSTDIYDMNMANAEYQKKKKEWESIAGSKYMEPEQLRRAELEAHYNTIRNSKDYNDFVGTNRSIDDSRYKDVNGTKPMDIYETAMSSKFKRNIGTKLAGESEDYMSDDEKKMYNYLYAREGKASADEYYNNLQLWGRKANVEHTVNEWGYRGGLDVNLLAPFSGLTDKEMDIYLPWISDAMSVLDVNNKAEGVVTSLLTKATGGDIDPGENYLGASRHQKDIRGITSEHILSNDNNLIRTATNFAYQNGMSIADFLYTSAITGGYLTGTPSIAGGIGSESMMSALAEGMSLAMMGTGAGADSILEAKEEGMTDERAITLGVIAGIVEVITEKIGYDALFNAEASTARLEYLLNNAFSEGAEEATSDVLNWSAEIVYDIFTQENQTEFQKLFNQYSEQYDPQGAMYRAIFDMIKEVGLDALGGMISGSFMGGTQLGLSEYDNLKNTMQTGRNLKRTEGGQAFLTEAARQLASGDLGEEGQKIGARVSNKLENNKRVSSLEAGKTARAYYSADFTTSARKAYGALGDVVTNLEKGEQISDDSAKAILTSPYLVNSINEESTTKITNESDIDTVKKAVTEYANKDALTKYSRTFGEEGRSIFLESYNPEMDRAKYTEEFTKVYNAGVDGKTADSVQLSGILSNEVVSRAFTAGINDSQLKEINYEENRQSGSRGQKRTYSVRSQGKLKGLPSTAEQSIRNYEARRLRGESEQRSVLAHGEGAVTTQDASKYVSEALPGQQIRVVNPSAYTKRISALSERLGKLGYDLVATLDSVKVEGGSVRGEYIERDSKTGRGTILIQVNNSSALLEELGLHEEFHTLVADNKGLLEETRKSIVEGRSEKELRDVVNAYMEMYKGSGYDAESILEEICADAYAGIDVFSIRSLNGGATMFTSEVRDLVKSKLGISAMNELEKSTVEFASEQAEDSGKTTEEIKEAVDNHEPVTPIEETRHSLVRDAELMNEVFEWNRIKKPGHGFLTSTDLSTATYQRSIVRRELMNPKILKLLPDETFSLSKGFRKSGKNTTIFGNTSYGWSAENTTVCIRSLTLEGIFDNLATRLGHSLSTEECITISEMAAVYAGNERTCQYCYVFADRVAERNAKNVYMKERAKAIEALGTINKGDKTVNLGILGTNKVTTNKNGTTKESRKFDVEEAVRKRPDLEKQLRVYDEYLNDRDNTPNMQKRFMYWVDAVQNGREIVSEDMTTTDSAMAKAKREHKNLSWEIGDINRYAKSASHAKTKVGYTAYNGDILGIPQPEVDKMNQNFGIRFYSYSDYHPSFVLENMQMFTDAAARGLKGLAYTKDLDYAKIFAPTGANINVSIKAMDEANPQTGEFEADEMQGAPWEESKELREKYPNVGTVLVATSDAQVEWALAQDWIDVVIPYHVVFNGDIGKAFGWKNYKMFQEDSKKPGWNGESGNVKSITPPMHQNDKATYLRLCAENNLNPRFEQWKNNPNYMKLVNETRRSEGNTPLLKPNFDTNAAKESIKKLLNKGEYGTPFQISNEVGEWAENDIYNRIQSGEKFDPETKSIRKFSMTVDSEGNNLTESQAEFFKDSMIRDKNGNLLKVYHGTPTGDFTVFKHDITYFTADRSYAERYQNPGASSIRSYAVEKTNPKVFEGYLNVKNLFDISDPENRRIFVEEYIKGGWAQGINPYLSDAELNKQIKDGIDWIEADNLKEFFDEEGYDFDGILLNEGGDLTSDGTKMRGNSYAIFNSNQFKETTNLNPTENKDIRYSKEVNSDGDALTEAQMDYFKDSLARDKDGRLKVYYHGTENGGFTIFDPGRSDDGISMFFTDLLYNAKSYSGSPEVYTPKALKTVEDFNEFLNKFDSINIERTYVTEQDGEYAFMYDGDVEFTSDNLDDLWEEISFEMGIGDGPTNYAVYLNAKNPLIVDGHGHQWNDLDPISGKGDFVPGESDDIVLNRATTREYSEYAKENGYDSVIFRNIYDYGGYKRDTDTAEVVVVFNSNQVKSVANTNPTEHRDIRYSLDKSSTVEEVYAMATGTQNRLNEMCRLISNKFGYEYNDVTQKSIKSLRNKVERKGNGYTAYDAKDHTRTNIMMDDFSSIPKVLDEFDRYGIPYVTENVKNPWGYNGFHVTWRNANGVTSEVQLTTKDHWPLKLWSDSIYDKWRNVEIDNMSPSEFVNYKSDVQISRRKWEEAHLPDLEVYVRNSSSESGRASNMSAPYTLDAGLDQDPSTYSNNTDPDKSKILPSSVMHKSFMDVTPPSSDNSILSPKSSGINNQSARKNSLEPTTSYSYLNEQTALLSKQVGLLSSSLEHYKSELKLTHGKVVTDESVKKAARDVLKDYKCDVKSDELAPVIKEISEAVLSGDADFDAIEQKSLAIARKIVDSTMVRNNADDTVELSNLTDITKRKDGIKVSPDSRMEFTDGYNRFVRENAWWLHTNNNGSISVDSLLGELQNSNIGWMFNDIEYTNDGATLMEIQKVVSDNFHNGSFVLQYENNRGLAYAEAVEGVKNQILTSALDDNVIKIRETFADKKKAEAIEKVKKAVKEANEISRQKTQEALQKEHDAYQKKLDAYKDKRKSKDIRKEYIRKIENHVKKLSKTLTNPTDKRHILKELQGPVATLLESINLSSTEVATEEREAKRGKNKGVVKEFVAKDENGNTLYKTKEGTKRTDAFNRMKEIYRRLATDGNIVIEPDLLGDTYHDGLFDEVIKMGDTPIRGMTNEQLDTVWKAVRAIESAVRSADKMFKAGRFATVSEYARAIQEENIGKNKKEFVVPQLQKLLTIDMITPETYWHMLGDVGDDLFRKMRDAQDTAIRIYEEAKNFAEKNLVTDYRKLEKEMHKVKLGATHVELSTAQLMELYLLWHRPQAAYHIVHASGGISLNESRSKTNNALFKDTNATSIRKISSDDINNALALLKPEYIEMAEKMQKFGVEVLAKHGNKAAMEVYGYEKFGDPDYWRIRTNSGDVKKDMGTTQGMITSVSGAGMAQPLTKNANTSIMLGSIFDTFSNSVTEMANYSAWLSTMEDINRIRNYKFLDADGNRIGTMAETFDRVYGIGGTRYLEKLMGDLANGVKSEQQFFGGLFGNFKAAAVGANLRVVIQQPTAIFRAMDMINPIYLGAGAKTWKVASGWKEAMKYSAIATWKDWGFFDIHTGRQMKDILFTNTSPLARVNDALMKPAGWADSVGWGWLWNSCKAEVKKKTGYDGEALLRATAKRFDEVIDHTQVVDGIMQRSQMMRSSDALTKMATAFMGEPTKQYNMFVSAMYDFNTDKSGKTALRLGRSVTTLLVAGVINAVAQSIIDGVRDDDKEKKYLEKVFANLFGEYEDEASFFENVGAFFQSNIGDSVNFLNNIPYVKDIVSIVQGYDVKRTDTQLVSNLVQSVQNVTKSLNGKGKMSVQNAMITLISTMGTFFGVPATNIKKDLYGLVSTVGQIVGDPVFEYKLMKFMYQLNNSEIKKDVFVLLDEARKKNPEAFEIIKNDLIKDKAFDTATKSTEKVIDDKMGEIDSGNLYQKMCEKYGIEPQKDATPYDIVIGMYMNGDENFLKAYDELIANGYDKKKIKSKVEDYLKEVEGVDYVNELSQRFEDPHPENPDEDDEPPKLSYDNKQADEFTERKENEKDAFDIAIETLHGSEYYEGLKASNQEKVENAISKMYKGDWDSLDKVRTYEKEAGIDESMYVLYNAALYASDSDGNGSFKKEEKVDALTKLVNDGTFTKKQAAYMFDQLYKKDNPFK